MEKNIRIYVATSEDCKLCKPTLKVLGSENGKSGNIAGVPVYPVDLSLKKERAEKMNVKFTPHFFVVSGNDDDKDGVWEENEESVLLHDFNGEVTKEDLPAFIQLIEKLKNGKQVRTKLN